MLIQARNSASRAGERPTRGWRRLGVATALALALGSAGAVAYVIDQSAEIEVDEPITGNPVEAVIQRGGRSGVQASATAPSTTAAAAGAIASVPVLDHEARLTLDVGYSESLIYNPSTGQYDRVRLRSYHSPGTAPAVPFVAPTIAVSPGETVRIALNNHLPDQEACSQPVGNAPNSAGQHCFNATNLHGHGLWVSPSGNSDNVLVSVRPGVRFEYEYNIPADHPAGTYWYHPHTHGSSALQVSSGLAGALIVRGSRLPAPDRNGDIDTLLRKRNGSAVTERVMLMQQVQYACRDENGKIKVKRDAAGKVIAWTCDAGDVGGVEGYDQFGSFSWRDSNRYTSINGRIMPTFTQARAGQLERWRMIHAGVRNSINLQFRKLRPGAAPMGRLRAEQQAAWIQGNCTGDVLPQWEIASDGLTHSRVVRKNANVMHPGYRSDVLMVFPEPGEYCVIDAAAPLEASVGLGESRQLLGRVQVSGGRSVRGDLQDYLAMRLMAAADQFMPTAMVSKVKSDLASGLQLNAFVPHPAIADDEVTGQQNVVLDHDPVRGVWLVDGQPYDPTKARTLVLGNVEEWTVSSLLAGHPYHVHVNPFEVVRILNPEGVDVSVTGEPEDPQYANTKGTWRDTLFIKQGYRAVLRSRYQRYIGEFVLHCHILDHQDLGMMQNVRIVLPDGRGGGLEPRHH